MQLKTLIKDTSMGKCLNEKEINILASKLGLFTNRRILIFKALIASILLIFGITLLVIINNFMRFVLFALIIFLIIMLFCYKNNTKVIINYLEAIKGYYLNRFKDYEGFESVFLIHEFQKSGWLQNHLCILITDGYDFYIFDDFLKETAYALPRKFKAPDNKKPVLKVFDKNFVDKKPVYFKLSDINYYQLAKDFDDKFLETASLGSDYKRYSYSISNYELKNYCLLELNDHSIFKFSPEAIRILRKKAKSKERMKNE